MNIERLEGRQLLAGAVYAVPNDATTLGIAGGPEANHVTVGYAADKNRNYVLADDLIIDGKPFTDGRYFFKQPNIDISLSDGNDTLTITGGNFDHVLIELGNGDDRVEWSGDRSGSVPNKINDVDLYLDAGDDRLATNDISVTGVLNVHGGYGRDRLNFNGRTNTPTLLVDDPGGATRLNLAGPAIDSLLVQTGNAIDRVTISGGYIYKSLKIATNGGDDVVSLTGYDVPPGAEHVVEAGEGTNQVTDAPTKGTPTVGRLDAVFRGKELDLVGSGPLRLSFIANYGSFEEDNGTYVDTDTPIYVNGVRQQIFLLDRVPAFSVIRVRMDDAVQRVNVDFDGFLFSPPTLDIATGGGNDTVNVTSGPANLGIDTGRGDDVVGLAYSATSTVRLGAGRDWVEVLGGQQVNIYDASGPATVVVDSANIAGGLYIETSDAIDHVTLKNVTATRLGLRLGGGRDVLSETDVRAKHRDIDLGAQ